MTAFHITNPHVETMHVDFLYHLGLDTTMDLEKLFGDVRFVVVGGTSNRMEKFAKHMLVELDIHLPPGTQIQDMTHEAKRYSMYKAGPVLSVSHGMGIPSINILLHEVIKLVYHAKCKDVIFLRMGTCGGIGIEGGAVVISSGAVDGMLNEYMELAVLGKLTKKPAPFDQQIVRELKAIATKECPEVTVIVGKTMCTLDFYEGQARIDGAFCEYSERDKMDYLESLKAAGITNIEMESIAMAALTHQAGIRAGCVCCALLNRLRGDQVNTPADIMAEWQNRPMKIIGKYIKAVLKGGFQFEDVKEETGSVAKETGVKEKEAKEKEAKEKEAQEKETKEKGVKEKEAKEKGVKEKVVKKEGEKIPVVPSKRCTCKPKTSLVKGTTKVGSKDDSSKTGPSGI